MGRVQIFFERTNENTAPWGRCFDFGAGNETRTRDPDLGKVVLYQLSYSRISFLQPSAFAEG